MKKQFLILFAFISVLAFGQVPQRFNKVVVTGDITSPKFIKTGSNADSVLLGNGSARAISTIKTDTVGLSNRINAKATGTGTANGTNTGDETLTSIKTKLGAASAVSDGYLKYQDWSIFNSKEPAITKNTGFNKNFGTTPGTVLEGRTFGTAANSSVGDFQPAITGLTANYLPKWNGSFVNSLLYGDVASLYVGSESSVFSGKFQILSENGDGATIKTTGAANSIPLFLWNSYTSGNPEFLRFYIDNGVNKGAIKYNRVWDAISISSTNIELDAPTRISSTTTSTSPTTGALVVNGGIGADHVRANNFYGNGSTLTGVQLPITLTTTGTSGAATFSGNVLNVPNYGNVATSGHYTPTLTNTANISSSSIIADANYSRIGNIVTITLSANVTPTLIGTLTHLTFTLPITTVSTSQQYIGSGVAWFGSSSSIGTFSVESASTAVFRFVPTITSTSAVSGTFQYRID